MAKIMLVEDDNNLREIYEARLLAEGYEIVAAKDGEEALALAVKERPDLIISDVMMPKISGFDMLDILRSTPETKDTKVIMMTALSQAEDKARADKLGADRYLVKSQVTLEDVAKVAREVLEGKDAPLLGDAPAPATAAPPAPADDQTAAAPVADAPDADTADPSQATTSNDEPVTAIGITQTAVPADDTSAGSAPVSPQAISLPAENEQADVEVKIQEFVDEPAPVETEEVAAPAPDAATQEVPGITPERDAGVTEEPQQQAERPSVDLQDMPAQPDPAQDNPAPAPESAPSSSPQDDNKPNPQDIAL